MSIKPDDPRLTAYVLGELGKNERARIEAAVKESPELQEAVGEIQAMTDLLSEQLSAEPTTGLSGDQRLAIEAKAASHARPRFRTRRFLWVSSAVAASLLILVGVTYSLLPSLSRAREMSRRTVNLMASPASATGGESHPDSAFRSHGSSGRKPRPQMAPVPKQQALIRLQSLGYVSEDTGGGSGGATRDAYDGSPWSYNGNVQNSSGDVSYLYGCEILFGEPGARSGFDTEAYDRIVDNPFRAVVNEPLSTFSIDVDTASYANVRRFLNGGRLPPKDAVRIEEMVNYFSYDYAPPEGDDPFSVNVEIGDCPWFAGHRLARIGLKGWEVELEDTPPSNLVFLIDVSGSMQPENKLPLLKRAMEMLVLQLTRDDSVAIVVYAGATGLVLSPTSGDDVDTILGALDGLQAGGSTNGGAGMQLAYDTAEQAFIEGGINRVIWATDGDFNVGVTSQGDLVRLIEAKAKSGVFLTVLGVGTGNYKDSTLEKLADKGNGNYAYIDTLNEARKVLVEQMTGTLVTIAKDVKIQIEFNPAEVAAYRLIGYENRLLAKEDFNDDTKDAGEIGAGHTVTALYELVPAGQEVPVGPVDPLKYQTPSETAPAAADGEVMTIKLRYKEPDGAKSKLLEFAVTDDGATWADSSEDFRFAASVAAFGMLLRGSPYIGDFTCDAVLEIAQGSLGEDAYGYRGEFVGLVESARALQNP